MDQTAQKQREEKLNQLNQLNPKPFLLVCVFTSFSFSSKRHVRALKGLDTDAGDYGRLVPLPCTGTGGRYALQ